MQILNDNLDNKTPFGMALYMPSENELLKTLSKRSVKELEKARPKLIDLSKDIDIFVSAKNYIDSGLIERVSCYIQNKPLPVKKINNILHNVYNKLVNILCNKNKSSNMIFEDKYIQADRIVQSLKAQKYILTNKKFS